MHKDMTFTCVSMGPHEMGEAASVNAPDQVSAELGGQYADVVAAGDVALYGGLAALASFDRAELKRGIVESTAFRELLELNPDVRMPPPAAHRHHHSGMPTLGFSALGVSGCPGAVEPIACKCTAACSSGHLTALGSRIKRALGPHKGTIERSCMLGGHSTFILIGSCCTWSRMQWATAACV